MGLTLGGGYWLSGFWGRSDCLVFEGYRTRLGSCLAVLGFWDVLTGVLVGGVCTKRCLFSAVLVSPYVRTVKTASGATAVQVVWSSSRGSRSMDHIGSAHTPEDVEVLKAVARQRMIAAGQDELDLGDGRPRHRAMTILASRAEHLWDALSAGFDRLGFDIAAEGDEVFRALVLGRLVEPTSKLDTLRVLEEIRVRPPGYATVKRRLPGYAGKEWRRRFAAACAHHVGLGPVILVLYGVSSFHFETDTGEGFWEPGYSKERRLEPQITIGLLTDAHGFPLMMEAFEGNRAETTTLIVSIQAFQAAHALPEVTVVADAGMLSDGNLPALSEVRTALCRWSEDPRHPPCCVGSG